jgi:hypothetical protein
LAFNQNPCKGVFEITSIEIAVAMSSAYGILSTGDIIVV